MNDLTQEILKSLVHYDPETGLMTWVEARNSRARKGEEAGSVNKHNGYRYVHIDYRRYLIHRLTFLYMTGRWPTEIDHIDGDRLNNKWANLREVTRRQNSRNLGVRTNNASGVVGVHWSRPCQRWMATIRVNYKRLYLGAFKDISDAITARKQAETQYQFHSNHGQRPARRSGA